LTGGQEVALNVLHPGFHDALLGRVAWRTRVDLEAVALGALSIGALHQRVVDAGPGDGALGVVDDQARGHGAEPFEGAPMAAQPGGHRLIEHELDVLVARPAQRHHEEPGFETLAAEGMGDQRPSPKIDLGGFARFEVEPKRDIGYRIQLQLM
jgi:hypothetical protein